MPHQPFSGRIMPEPVVNARRRIPAVVACLVRRGADIVVFGFVEILDRGKIVYIVRRKILIYWPKKLRHRRRRIAKIRTIPEYRIQTRIVYKELVNDVQHQVVRAFHVVLTRLQLYLFAYPRYIERRIGQRFGDAVYHVGVNLQIP